MKIIDPEPVFQRMMAPKAHAAAKRLNFPRILVNKWRAKAEHARDCLARYVDPREIELASQYLLYLEAWIDYAESILNDGADPSNPFTHQWPRGLSVYGEHYDPAQAHPVVRIEDFHPDLKIN